MPKWFSGLLNFLANVSDIWSLISALFFTTGGSGALITYIIDLPIVYPITLGSISALSLVVLFTRLIINYMKWKSTIEERRKIVEEKREAILTIPDTLQQLTNQQMNVLKELINKGVSRERAEDIGETIRMRLKLKRYLLPTSLVQAMEITKKTLNKMNISVKKPQNVIDTGLLLGWVLNDRGVGLYNSQITEANTQYLEIKKELERKTPKISTKELSDAVLTLRNVIWAADSTIICKEYYWSNKMKVPVELADQDTPLSEYEYKRESEIQMYLQEIRRLAENECRIE